MMRGRGDRRIWEETAMEHQPMSKMGASVFCAGHSVTNLLIVDDHPLMCEALSRTLAIAFDLKRVRSATSLAAAEASIRADGPPDAVVLDLEDGVTPDRKDAARASAIQRSSASIVVTVS